MFSVFSLHSASPPSAVKISYINSGVDIGAGESLVERIKPAAAATARAGCKAELGGFGGVFDLKAAGYRDPLLISGADGVGTKLKASGTLVVRTSITL